MTVVRRMMRYLVRPLPQILLVLGCLLVAVPWARAPIDWTAFLGLGGLALVYSAGNIDGWRTRGTRVLRITRPDGSTTTETHP